MEHDASRRTALQVLAGAALLVAATPLARARDTSALARLIEEARMVAPAPSDISQRIEFISRSLLGVRYQAHTLIGGPRTPEEFVVRDDAFDCVTFCETALAAALARDLGEFEAVLRKIRYAHGEVRWEERNHYFSEWSRRAVENDICRPVPMPHSIAIAKTVNWGNLGQRRISMVGIQRRSLLANRHLLSTGDIIGFVSRRPNLDFFHTGLVAFGAGGELLLRHASQSRRKVLDERLDRFLAVNGVRFVTLLRPLGEPVRAAAR